MGTSKVWETLSAGVSVTDCGVSIDDPDCGRVLVRRVGDLADRDVAAILADRLGSRWVLRGEWSAASGEPGVTAIWGAE